MFILEPPRNVGINNPLPAKWFFNKPASISSNRIWFKPTPHRITLFFKLIIRDWLENWQNITDLPDCTIYCCELLKRGQINKVLIFTYSLIRDNIHTGNRHQYGISLREPLLIQKGAQTFLSVLFKYALFVGR